MAIESERLLTVKEVAERLRVHPITVRRLIASGRLRSIHIGRTVRVRANDLQAFLYNKRSAGADRRSRPTSEGLRRRREAVDRILAFRARQRPLGITTEELVRQGRDELERRADRYLGLDR